MNSSNSNLYTGSAGEGSATRNINQGGRTYSEYKAILGNFNA